MMMWASAQWSNEGLLEMINEKVSSLIWNSKIWLAAEGAWDDDVSQSTAHCFVSSNSFHGQITQKAVH